MNPWIAKAVVLVSSVMMIVIRAPHGQRSRGLNVVNLRIHRERVLTISLYNIVCYDLDNSST